MDTFLDELVDNAAQVTTSLKTVAATAAAAASTTAKHHYSEIAASTAMESSSSWKTMLPSLWLAAQQEQQRLQEQQQIQHRQQLLRKRRRPLLVPAQPPSSLDLFYITDRILASSEPSRAPVPTFNDVGRDDSQQCPRLLLRPKKQEENVEQTIEQPKNSTPIVKIDALSESESSKLEKPDEGEKASRTPSSSPKGLSEIQSESSAKPDNVDESLMNDDGDPKPQGNDNDEEAIMIENPQEAAEASNSSSVRNNAVVHDNNNDISQQQNEETDISKPISEQLEQDESKDDVPESLEKSVESDKSLEPTTVAESSSSTVGNDPQLATSLVLEKPLEETSTEGQLQTPVDDSDVADGEMQSKQEEIVDTVTKASSVEIPSAATVSNTKEAESTVAPQTTDDNREDIAQPPSTDEDKVIDQHEKSSSELGEEANAVAESGTSAGLEVSDVSIELEPQGDGDVTSNSAEETVAPKQEVQCIEVIGNGMVNGSAPVDQFVHGKTDPDDGKKTEKRTDDQISQSSKLDIDADETAENERNDACLTDLAQPKAEDELDREKTGSASVEETEESEVLISPSSPQAEKTVADETVPPTKIDNIADLATGKDVNKEDTDSALTQVVEDDVEKGIETGTSTPGKGDADTRDEVVDTSGSVEKTQSSPNSTQQSVPDNEEASVTYCPSSAAVDEEKEATAPQHPPAPEPLPRASVHNSPATIANYLERRHGKRSYLAYNLSDNVPDDRTLLLLRRQIVQLGWWSPCAQRSETPSIPHLLKVCYAIHAFLQLDPANVVLVYCANGKTRTAIAIACYLKFVGLVRRTSDGFLQFLISSSAAASPTTTGSDPSLFQNANAILKQLPPSLLEFFRQFDSVLELGGYMNRKPLWLRAIALQGIPVEDKPCLDIWDSSKRHIYSSHPEIMFRGQKQEQPPSSDNDKNKATSQWADEEGFYRVNVVLDGDFLLLCRFGGDFAEEGEDDATIHDPTKILFRYANTTGFLSGGCPYELPPGKVDLMRRYATHLDHDDFLVTLLFEANWEDKEEEENNVSKEDCTPSSQMDPLDIPHDIAEQLGTARSSRREVWRSNDPEACEEGWNVILNHHSAHPNTSDVRDFQKFNRDLAKYSPQQILLGLQLANFDYKEAGKTISTSLLGCTDASYDYNGDIGEGKESSAALVAADIEADNHKKIVNAQDDWVTSNEPLHVADTQKVLNILEDVSVETDIEYPDIKHICSYGMSGTAISSLTGDSRGPDRAAYDFENDVETPKRRGGRPRFDSEDQGDNVNNDNQEPCHGSIDGNPLGLGLARDGWMVPSLMYPRQGDVVGAFGPYYEQMKLPIGTARPYGRRPAPVLGSSSLVSHSRPLFPIFPRDRPAVLPPPLRNGNGKDQKQGFELSSLSSNISNQPVPPHDSQQQAATELLLQVRHTGVSLSGLLKLVQSSKQWGAPDILEDDKETVEEDQAYDSKDSAVASRNREAKELQEKKWQDAQKAEAQQKSDIKKEQNEKKKEDTVKKKEEVNREKKLEEDTKGEEKKTEKDEETKTEKEEVKPKAEETKADEKQGELPLKDDPDYAKYFKMLKMGMAKEQVLHALKRDDKDPIVLDLDPNKSLKSQLPEEPEQADEDVPLKDDPEYSKYFKMLKMGMAKEQVLHALTRDGKDASVLELDPNKSLKSQQPKEAGGDVPLKDDPEYEKYFKMLSMGLPMGAVKNALVRDGKDPAIMDLDHNKSVKSQLGGGDADDGPPLKDDPEYSKYFKMLTMGLPMGAVKNALGRDGKDPTIMDLDPNKSLKSQLGGGEADTGPPLKEDPDYVKYFKMLEMGLPMGAVKNALGRDGKDPSVMDLDPNKSLKSQIGGGDEKDTGTPLKDDPDYQKYFKMLGMGLPLGAVKNAVERDGKDPAVMDLDPNKSVAFQMKKKATHGKKATKKKKRVRRKKIYWNPIEPTKIKEDSMWHIVRGSIVMDKLSYDIKEFEDLFTESADPKDKKKKAGNAKKAEKKAVQVIDGKRSMNGGIILARLKIDYSTIAEIVDKMEHGKFDSTQLKALKEYLPESEERGGLVNYMKKGDASEEAKAEVYGDLSEAEKYMVTMMKVTDAGKKFDAMLFRTVFKSRFEELTTSIRTLNTACDEVRTSERLRKLMAMILTVVNQINTGGEGNMALGFTLDALLKLNEAKAFDKKTSVLHYLVKLMKKNDESLLRFDADLGSIPAAENVILDSLGQDMKAITEDLKNVHETVSAEAARLEEAGELKPMTLTDLAEQRTTVRQVGAAVQYNKISHLTGRTSMERFTINAKATSEQAVQSIDEVKKKYSTLLAYFGEDEKMASTDFFGILRRFMVEFKKATEQVEAIDKAAAKEKKKAAAKAAKAKAKAERQSKKKKADESKEKKGGLSFVRRKSANEKEKSAPPAPGGIAALAAAAAKAPASTKVEKDDTTPAGGIAAFAAAAALRKESDKAIAQKNDATPPGGVAAMAAAAAARKTSASNKNIPVQRKVDAKALPGDKSFTAHLRKSKSEDNSIDKALSGDKLAESVTARLRKSKSEDKSVDGVVRQSDNTSAVKLHGPIANVEGVNASATEKNAPLYATTASKIKGKYDEKGEPAVNVDRNTEAPTEDERAPAYAVTASRIKGKYNEKGEPTATLEKRPSDTAPEYISAAVSFQKAYDSTGEPSTSVDRDDGVEETPGKTPAYATTASRIKSKYNEKGEPTAIVEKRPSDTTPEYLSAAVSFQKGYNAKGEPMDATAATKTEDSGAKSSAFAANVAAYRRRRKSKMDPEGEDSSDKKNTGKRMRDNNAESGDNEESGGTPSFKSSAAAYRRKKSIKGGSSHDAAKKAQTPPIMRQGSFTRQGSFSLLAPSPMQVTIGGNLAMGPSKSADEVDQQRQNKRKSSASKHRTSKSGGISLDDYLSKNSLVSAPSNPLMSPLGNPLTSPPGSSFMSPPGGSFMSPPGVKKFLARAARSFDKDLDDASLDSMSMHDAVMTNVDDASISQISFARKPIESGMSETWTQGDTIPNWVGWANQVIQACDTDSVVGFEQSMDLDPNDDDDSTVASYATMNTYDDSTVASFTTASSTIGSSAITSSTTASKVASSILFDDEAETSTGVATTGVTPASVAASILFEDSPVNSDTETPAKSNLYRGRSGDENDDFIDPGLSYGANDVQLDAGLSFGADDVGLDAGLSFFAGEDIGNGLGFGGSSAVQPPPNPPQQQQQQQSPEKQRKWFNWGNN